MLSTGTAVERLQAVLSPKRGGVKQHRYCERCGMHHYDAQFKLCGTCREIAREKHYLRYWDHVSQRLCTVCNNKPEGRYRKCRYHLDMWNGYVEAIRERQIEKGLCQRGACPEEPSGGNFCEKHRIEQNVYKNTRRKGWSWTDRRLRANRELPLTAAAGRKSLRAVHRRESRKAAASTRRAR